MFNGVLKWRTSLASPYPPRLAKAYAELVHRSLLLRDAALCVGKEVPMAVEEHNDGFFCPTVAPYWPEDDALKKEFLTTFQETRGLRCSQRCEVDGDAVTEALLGRGLVPEVMGVSKAVLENVIFCHQEESNWYSPCPATRDSPRARARRC